LYFLRLIRSRLSRLGFFDEGTVSTILENMLTDIANSAAEALERLDEEIAEAAEGPAE